MQNLETVAAQIGCGQRLEEMLQHKGWGDVQQVIATIYEKAIAEALDPKLVDTTLILSLRARAAAIKELRDTLNIRINELIENSKQLRSDSFETKHSYF